MKKKIRLLRALAIALCCFVVLSIRAECVYALDSKNETKTAEDVNKAQSRNKETKENKDLQDKAAIDDKEKSKEVDKPKEEDKKTVKTVAKGEEVVSQVKNNEKIDSDSADDDEKIIDKANYKYKPGQINPDKSKDTNLGYASDGFVFFLFDKLEMTSGDSCGRVAVKNSISWTNYMIHGDLIVQKGASIKLDKKENVCGGIYEKEPSAEGTNGFFDIAENDLKRKCTLWANMATLQSREPDSGTAGNELTLYGENDKFNVFNITVGLLNKYNCINIIANESATNLINIHGKINDSDGKCPFLAQDTVKLNGSQLGDHDDRCSKILWNFPDADKIDIGCVRGSVLAPYAEANVVKPGNVAGTIVAKSLISKGGWEGHFYPFSGVIDNTRVPNIPMPLTGGIGTMVFTIIGLLIMSISILLLVLYEKKSMKKGDTNNEN